MSASIAIELKVNDKGSVVVRKFTDATVNKVKQMSDRSMGAVEKLSKKFTGGLGGAISKVSKGLLNLKTMAVAALTGWGLKTLAAGMIKVGSSMDQMKISLDTITKGHGLEWFNKLNTWALKMPVNTQKAIQSFTMMRAMGLDPTIKQMTILVDTMSALGGSADTMEGISRALGQIKTKGKVSAEELMQLAERGVPVFDILKKKFGDVKTSTLDATQAIAAIFEGMGDRFGGQSKKIQDKWIGLTETLKSYWTEFQRLVMDSGLMDYLEKNLKKITAYLDTIYSNGELKKYAKETGDKITSAIKKVIKTGKSWTQFLSENYKMIKKIAIELVKFYAIAKVVGGITAVATFFETMSVATNGLTASVILLNKAMKGTLPVLAAYAAYKTGEFIYSKASGLGSLEKEIEKDKAWNARLKETLAERQQQEPADNSGGVVSKTAAQIAQEQEKAAAEQAKISAQNQIKSMINVAETEKKLLTQRLSENEKFYSSLADQIKKNADLEKQHIKELMGLYQQKDDIQKSSDQLVQGLKEKTMTPEEKYQSQKSALDQQYADALLLSGQEQVKALEEYKQAVSSFANTYSDGVKETSTKFGVESSQAIVSSDQIIQNAIQNIQAATELQQNTLDDLAAEKQKQISEDQIWGEALSTTAKDVADDIEALQDTISGLSNKIESMTKTITINAVDKASPVVGNIQKQLNMLHDKTVTITTVQRTVSAGGDVNTGLTAPVKGTYRYGTNYVPSTGLYQLHQGEKVITNNQASHKTSMTGDIIINIPESSAPQRPEDWREITRTYIKPELERLGNA